MYRFYLIQFLPGDTKMDCLVRYLDVDLEDMVLISETSFKESLASRIISSETLTCGALVSLMERGYRA